jgi:hypothetical protein
MGQLMYLAGPIARPLDPFETTYFQHGLNLETVGLSLDDCHCDLCMSVVLKAIGQHGSSCRCPECVSIVCNRIAQFQQLRNLVRQQQESHKPVFIDTDYRHADHRKNIPHFVYRCFDKDNTLLYVGRSCNVMNRIYDHREKPWGKDISKITTESYKNFSHADYREQFVIGAERPLHNRQHCERPKPKSFQPSIQEEFTDDK